MTHIILKFHHKYAINFQALEQFEITAGNIKSESLLNDWGTPRGLNENNLAP